MSEITTIGLDLAKRVFQVHGVGADGEVMLRRQLKRRQLMPFFSRLPACLIGIEACGTWAFSPRAGPVGHHWGRMLQGLGHQVRLIAPAYAKAYVRRNRPIRQMPRRYARR